MRIEIEGLEELRRLVREEPLFPGQADAGPADGFRILASDDPALSPDAARWTPEDDG